MQNKCKGRAGENARLNFFWSFILSASTCFDMLRHFYKFYCRKLPHTAAFFTWALLKQHLGITTYASLMHHNCQILLLHYSRIYSRILPHTPAFVTHLLTYSFLSLISLYLPIGSLIEIPVHSINATNPLTLRCTVLGAILSVLEISSVEASPTSER